MKIDMLRGADPAALEEKIKKWYQDDEEDGEGDLRIKGHVWNHFVLFFYTYYHTVQSKAFLLSKR